MMATGNSHVVCSTKNAMIQVAQSVQQQYKACKHDNVTF